MGKGRKPCCAKVGLNKGSWTPEEDMRLIAYIQKYGHANWRALPKQAGLLRCGKSCRLRWINYLRPDLKRGNFTAEEEETIIKLHAMLGNKWSKIAACLPGRTDNEIKNVWNTHLKKRVAPQEQERSAKKKKLKKSASSAAEEATVPSPSPASSTTTTTTNSSSSGDSTSGVEHEQQSMTPDELEDLRNLDIPMLDDTVFDFDMPLAVDAVPELYSCPSAPTSPCVSSTSPPPVVDHLLDLPPEIDIDDHELWSIIDGDGFTETTPAAACHGNATAEANGAEATTTSQEESWWLENLERELGLWGPMEDYQYPTTGPLGLAHPDPPLPAMVQDPVTSYFQPGPTATTFHGGPSELTTSNQMTS